jgi:hypothetical protein
MMVATPAMVMRMAWPVVVSPMMAVMPPRVVSPTVGVAHHDVVVAHRGRRAAGAGDRQPHMLDSDRPEPVRESWPGAERPPAV